MSSFQISEPILNHSIKRFQHPHEVQPRHGYISSPIRQPYYRPPLLHNNVASAIPAYSTSGVLTYPTVSSQSNNLNQFTAFQNKQAHPSNHSAATAFQTAYNRPTITAPQLPSAMPESLSYLTDAHGRTNVINTQQPAYNIPAVYTVSSRPAPQPLYNNSIRAAHTNPMYGMQAAHPVYNMPAFTSAQTVHGLQATQTVYSNSSPMTAHGIVTQNNPKATEDYSAYGMQIVSNVPTMSENQAAQTAYGMPEATLSYTVMGTPLAHTQTVYSRPTAMAAKNIKFYPSNKTEGYPLNVLNQELKHGKTLTSEANKMSGLKENLEIVSKEFENMTILSIKKLTEDLTAASVDSNVTIKNNEATESDSEEEIDDGGDHDPESLEWIQFLDSQIEETLENAR